MKQTLLFLYFVFFTFTLWAQQTTCTPDSTLADTVFIFPPPFSPDVPESGIPDSACVNQPFSFILHLKVPPAFNFGSANLELDSVSITTEGAIKGLPVGMQYSCNPPNCVFKPDTIVSGCITIYGTAQDTVGAYDLSLSATLYTKSLGPLPLELPNDLIPGAQGAYTLHVLDEDSANCFVDNTSATTDLLASKMKIENVPNPFSSYTQIKINSSIRDVLQFKVFDLLGRQVYRERVEVFEGDNDFHFDGSSLQNGIYVYTISNEDGMVSRKMVINH